MSNLARSIPANEVENIHSLPSKKNTLLILKDEQLSVYIQTLRNISVSSFYDEKWKISIPVSNLNCDIVFPPKLPSLFDQILRATVLENLISFASAQSAKKIISNATIINSFLAEAGIPIQNTRTALLDQFMSYLDSHIENPVTKNSILSTYALLFEQCSVFEIQTPGRTVDFSYRYREKHGVKRAPDQCVIDALTRLIFDFSYPMPLLYRCVLMILRLIPTRISEALAIDPHCVSYPSESCFGISIPTSKETVLHIPEYNRYYMLTSGVVENRFLVTLLECCRLHTGENNDVFGCNLLFYDKNKKRQITITDINNYLSDLIEKERIVDSSGKLSIVTTHDFRHIAVGERLRSGVYTPYEISIEANHKSTTQTIAYGYQSKHDEAGRQAQITSKFVDFPSENMLFSSVRKLSPKKFSQLEQSVYSRIIPAYGVCNNTSCNPQYESCIECEKFKPDPLFYDYFEASIKNLQKKIKLLELKKGSTEAISFNKRQLSVFESYVAAIEKTQKEGGSKDAS